jgi:hypothetical protein
MKHSLLTFQITILSIAFITFSSNHSWAQFDTIWSQTNYPSSSNIANAITVNANGVYVGGFDFIPGNKQFRLEKRNLTTGALITGFGTSGVITSNPTSSDDQINGIAIDGSGVYVTGSQEVCLGCNSKWRIEKRDLTTGTVIWFQISDPSVTPDGSNAITVDSSGVYVVGTVGISIFNWAWRVEKRDLFTGDTIWTQTIDPTFAGDSPLAIAADPSGIYVAGAVFDTIAGSGDRWRIEKRDLSTGGIIWSQSGNGERAQGIAVDTSGIYVAGNHFFSASDDDWRIEKRDLFAGTLMSSFGTGGIVLSNPGTGLDNATGISINSTNIYISGSDENSGDPQWRLEERDLITGALTCITSSNPSNGADNAYSITNDFSGIYIAGTDLITTNEEWRMEKYNFICNTSSLQDQVNENHTIAIFPNPFSLYTTLQSDKILEDATIIIYNSVGEQIRQINHIYGQTAVISRDNIQTGVYFVQLMQKGKMLGINKLVIAD